jgi:hypothetical protein
MRHARHFKSILFLASLLMVACCSAYGQGDVIQIIDHMGSLTGNALRKPGVLGTDDSGNVFVSGGGSNNVFKVTPEGTITQIIGHDGDGEGNKLDEPRTVAPIGSPWKVQGERVG